MTRHYSTRNFFRQMPHAYLARYFASREVLQDFDFAEMKETKVDALFDAWMALPEVVRVKQEAELREIWDMSCAAGTQGMLDEAEFHLDENKLAEFREGLMTRTRWRVRSHPRGSKIFPERAHRLTAQRSNCGAHPAQASNLLGTLLGTFLPNCNEQRKRVSGDEPETLL